MNSQHALAAVCTVIDWVIDHPDGRYASVLDDLRSLKHAIKDDVDNESEVTS